MARRTVLAGGSIAVDGLDETIRGLRKVNKTVAREANKASRKLVDDVVVPVAESKWSSQRIKPSVAGRVIKAQGTATSAGVNLRYSRFPYAAGVEYGSLAFSQFRPWRGNRFTVAPGSSTGYVVQDAIRDTLPEMEERWMFTVELAILSAIGAT